MIKYGIFIFGVLVLGVVFLRPSSSIPEPEEITLTIPEGYTARQMGELFEKSELFLKDEFLAIAQKEEGYLFPDTYRFFKKTTPEKVIEKMKKNFEEKTRDLSISHEIIIMASIIEKEVRGQEDRKIISGILWRRIKEGIGLQVDASLNYILGKTSAKLTADDLKVDSQYNTYKYRGLPVGPIGNPGLNAILAALNPSKSPYLFYLSDKDGVTRFAKNFEEHKANKLRYLR